MERPQVRGSHATTGAAAALTAGLLRYSVQSSSFTQPAPVLKAAAPSSRPLAARSTGPAPSVATGRDAAACAAVGAGALAGLISLQGSARKSGPRGLRTTTRIVTRSLAECPYTVYGSKDVDIEAEHQPAKDYFAPTEVKMPSELAGDVEGQRKYFAENLPKIYQDLKKHGAVIFRGFEISRDEKMFQDVGRALELEACEDPLHSVAARDAVNKEAGVYEAVNKPSRRKFYVGMHNEMVGNRAPGAAIFVCFKAAEEGGEFLLADGRKMFSELDKDWLREVYNREIQYSTAEFPMGFLEGLPDFAQSAVEPLAYGVMQQALKMKVDFDTQLSWEKSTYDGSKILQVRAMPQLPIVRHPATGEPVWWGSMHSHAEYLRHKRESTFGEEGFAETTGASRINKTDTYYADNGTRVEDDRLEHLDEVTKKSVVTVKMEPGDMVLLDNYMVMHGRCPFEGTRKHAVTWYKSPDYSKAAA
eukprot:CAMPEP_0170603190 /NCGR_PEP_ID=MMETSP0224-20130122/18783_1 /TAXON_ID=285029 /ORGANISM="Togula jolla, Strain CCCM 725" /LENGTH=473 /DNA_ID=CAMNT_0010928061 /DNA_START=45 /DNA_END=1466 /DNA_ORIENTATION=+